MTAMSSDDTGLAGFRAGHGRAEQWQDAVEAALRQMGDPPAGANLGFVYMTDWLAPAARAILTYLQQATGVEDWVGSVGIGILAAGVEYFDEPAVVVMLASLPEGEFQLFSPSIRCRLRAASRRQGTMRLTWRWSTPMPIRTICPGI